MSEAVAVERPAVTRTRTRKSDGVARKPAPTNNIKQARKLAGLSQADLGEALSVSQQTIAKLEAGDLPLKSDLAVQIAKLCNVRLEEIVGVNERARVPVIGKLGVNDLIYLRLNIAEPEWEEAPPLSHPDMLALHVVGDTAWPMYRSGDVLFLGAETHPSDNLGEECAVELTDGVRLVKRIMRGSRPERFHLASLTGPAVLEDQELASCRRVEFIRRGRRPSNH